MKNRWLAVSAGLVLAIATIANADVLHLRKGGRLEGIVTQETATAITMDIGMGHVSIARSSIVRIERKDSALAEYRSRLAHIAVGDVLAYADLARFAAEANLRGEARTMWARVASLDPTNVEAHLALGHVMVDGRYADETESYRARGFVYFDGRWMTPAEQGSLLREREQRIADERRVGESRRAVREAEDRARRAEAEAARARADAAASSSLPVWGYGGNVLVGSPHWGGYTSGGCGGSACTTVPQIWPNPQPAPAATPWPHAPPVRPSSIR